MIGTRFESLSTRFVTADKESCTAFFAPCRFRKYRGEGREGRLEGKKGGREKWMKQTRMDRAPRWPRRAACITLNYLSRNYSFMLIRLDTPADLELLPA